jgi:hypothetical protein
MGVRPDEVVFLDDIGLCVRSVLLLGGLTAAQECQGGQADGHEHDSFVKHRLTDFLISDQAWTLTPMCDGRSRS